MYYEKQEKIFKGGIIEIEVSRSYLAEFLVVVYF